MKDNGGPAFPQVRIWNPERREYEDAMYSSGMTLRDWFAGQALSGMLLGVVGKIGSASEISAYASGPCDAKIVERAFHIADAMLKEREK